MSLFCKFKVIPLENVPLDDLQDESGVYLPPTVLVVDDEPIVADTLSAILRRAGLSASAAYNGASALDMAERLLPELLITDVSMPKMNGVELAMILVSEQPKCKVLLFSGHATSADLATAVAAGHEFPLLTKPMHPTDLLHHVARTLELQDLRIPEKPIPTWVSDPQRQQA
jgi:CheY-like chemotaxis protein